MEAAAGHYSPADEQDGRRAYCAIAQGQVVKGGAAQHPGLLAAAVA